MGVLQAELWEGEVACRVPVHDGVVHSWAPARYCKRGRTFTCLIGGVDAVLVVAFAAVLGAIAAIKMSAQRTLTSMHVLPLRIRLITSNMSFLTSLATLLRLGVALARRATTGTGHCC